MVEIDVSKDFVDSMVINTPFLRQITQRVVYKWAPFYCIGCGKFRHKSSTCKWLKVSTESTDVQPYQGKDQVPQQVSGSVVQDSYESIAPKPFSTSESLISSVTPLVPSSSLHRSKHLNSPAANATVPISNPFQVLEPGKISQDELPHVVVSSEQGGTLGLLQERTGDHLENVGSTCVKLGQRSPFIAPVPPYISLKMHSGCSMLASLANSKTDKQGSPTFCFFEKLKSVKHALTKLHKKDFSHISTKARSSKTALTECQAKLVKIKHIQDSDCSSKYFFAKISERRHQQQIGILKDIHGVPQVRHDQVSQAFQDNYQGLLGQSSHVQPLSDEDYTGSRLSPEDSLNIAANITLKEIKDALFSTDINSSPGIDGFSAVISKILANRLQKVLPSLIGEEQAAFAKGRSIFENVMLSQALVKGYTRKHISPRCLIKVDIRKAFDCPLSSQIWLSSEGRSGIRQGDPLSPYLFILGMEILSRAMRKICTKPEVSYHPKCSSTNLTHLIFANDLMVFIRGDVPSASVVAGVLARFTQVSSLAANSDKTSTYFRGADPSAKELILHATGFSEGDFPFRYLGLPLNSSRIIVTMFDSLIIKTRKVVAHWSTHLHYYAGKLQLINSIIFGVENLWFSNMLLPQTIVQHIQKICKNFFEGIPDGERRMVFKNWHQISSPSFAGGANVKDLTAWNYSLLCKWILKLSLPCSSKWKSWVMYVLKQEDFWFVKAKDHFSFSMTSILTTRDHLISLAGSEQAAKLLIQSWIVNSKFNIQSAYGFFRNASAVGSWTAGLGHSSIIPSHKIICSLAAQHQLATVDNLQRRGISYANRCVLCLAHEENHAHLFFSCSVSSEIWQ
ncbi:uncharacterized protein LOC141649423 [Silene latifolia]|uniref:uncharacterized protein LOC141649423 n=1 Tax=Silene latifolia TaxID=37657 RepID=UPI003D77CC09